jgi:polyisoprenoid-binding protein YceI
MYKILTAAALMLSSQISFAAMWELNNTQSSLNFESTKNTDIKEESKFTQLKGELDDNTAKGKVEVSLNSVDTHIPLRDERLRELLFETARFATAEFTTQFDPKDIALLNDMQAHKLPVSGTLNLHGVTHEISTDVIVQKLNANTLQIKNAEPIVLDTSDYNFQAGMATLTKLAGLQSIDTSVPLSFTLIFDKK